MKKNIWIMNHYATNQLLDQAGRHYWFAKYLKHAGYEPVVFSCNVKHGTGGHYFGDDALWQVKEAPDGFPFVVIRSTTYQGNGLARVRNMLQFARNLRKTARQYARKYGKPDVILASSVHPFTISAGQKIAKEFGVPAIAEVRDLWPESMIAYGIIKNGYWIARLLYAFERKLYKAADAIIFTMPGGSDYIRERGWDSEHGGPVALNRVYHINNGVDIVSFDNRSEAEYSNDRDLADRDWFNLVYTGSIRFANNLDLVLDAAKLLNDTRARFLIWGTGDQVQRLQARCRDEEIGNVVFKGSVERNTVPSIVMQADATFFVLHSSPLYRFGLSLNKSFEYFAAGKPTIIVGDAKYSLVDEYQCGIHVKEATAEGLHRAVLSLLQMEQKELDLMGINARKCAADFDYAVLGRKLLDVIEGIAK